MTCFLVCCEPISPQQSKQDKKILFDNHNYEDIVGITKLFPWENGHIQELENPVVGLNKLDRIFLSFDLLSDQFESLSIKLYHCNKNWKKSILQDMEFLNRINSYRITEFDYSINTVQPYITYSKILPTPKISGNYVLAVFRRTNPDDVLLTRRFLVIDNKISIGQTVRVSNTINKREINHQIEYTIDYGNLQVNSPIQDIGTVILQNHNWHTSISGTSPTLVRANEGYMEYRHMDLKTNFMGWNEFRFVDLRTLNVSGRNVGMITNTGTKIRALLKEEGSRGILTYTQNFQDINGDYFIQNNDPNEGITHADYANVTFSLKSERINGEVYVWGRFNNWKLSDLNRMKFSNKNGVGKYEATIVLKQGYYEYMYYTKSDELPRYHFEGSHFQTENDYEILVYYRKPGNLYDELIGYKQFKSIER